MATATIPSSRTTGSRTVRTSCRGCVSAVRWRHLPPGASRCCSDAELLPAAPDSLSKVAQLVLDDFTDRVAGRLHVLLHPFLDLLGRNAVPELLAALGRPARAARALLAGPHGAAPGAAND